MKITLENVGPIASFTFDTEKDLHLIYGENSIGKSYAISMVYLFLKNWQEFLEEPYVNEVSYEEENAFLNKVKDILTEHSEVNITDDIVEIHQRIIARYFLTAFNNSCANSFRMHQLGNKYSQEPLKITVELESKWLEVEFQLNEKNEFFISRVDKKVAIFYTQKKTKENWHLQGEDKIFFYWKQQKNMLYWLIPTLLIIGNSAIHQLHFLPAVRFGIYQGLNALAPAMAMISQERRGRNIQINLPALSEPVSDYYLALSSLRNHSTTTDAILKEIIAELEQTILKGRIEMNTENNRIEYISHDLGLQLELTEVSSMMAEIGILTTFIKYLLEIPPKNKPDEEQQQHSSFLFIEEPEAHLHPKVQVFLMNVFAKLSNYGLKIVMTTHSDFMFNSLSNLLITNQIQPEKIASYHLVMGETGSYDKGDMGATKEGIEDHNFSETIEILFNERMNSYHQKNEIN